MLNLSSFFFFCIDDSKKNEQKTDNSPPKRQVTAVHKANIMKMSDGLILSEFRKVAAKYPSIKAEEMIVDNTSMQLASNPGQFDVLVRRRRSRTGAGGEMQRRVCVCV